MSGSGKAKKPVGKTKRPTKKTAEGGKPTQTPNNGSRRKPVDTQNLPIPGPRVPAETAGPLLPAPLDVQDLSADGDAAPLVPLGRSRLALRAASAIMTGGQLIPAAESLEPGLRAAVLVLLVLDVTFEVTASIGKRIADIFRCVRLSRASATRIQRDKVSVSVNAVITALPKRRKLRISGRLASATLIASQWYEGLQAVHAETLIFAGVILVVDIVTEISGRVSEKMSRWMEKAVPFRYSGKDAGSEE
ncbi:hypothetical protein [Streptomyces nigra]|uniref:hypothetical protein n=1 Tax=Streptomyces nigra TaxID=1827580 RepID=UPI0013DDD899|nr:hypothetical protein [Streptomyces nigra]